MLKSFVSGANHSLFSIHNLPYGVFLDHNETARIGVAIGDQVLDLTFLENEGLLRINEHHRLFDQGTLNRFAATGPACWAFIRHRIQSLLSEDSPELQMNDSICQRAFLNRAGLTLCLPFTISGFTDFYASEHHARNVGTLFRGPEQPLLPNWKQLPVAYNGRASTIFPSGTPIHRPQGLILPKGETQAVFNYTQKLDFELELGLFIGQGNPTRQPIPVTEAYHHFFGMVLLNDWSARDIQSFEYQPLGPFLSKSFATSISPWVVPMQALQGAFLPAETSQSPQPCPYLATPVFQPDIRLQVILQPQESNDSIVLCETNARELYWSFDQMLAHHTVNGCIMNPGDLLGTGTISGSTQKQCGSLLELTLNGTQPILCPDGQERRFLENGDTIVITGYAKVNDHSIGFGELTGTIV